VVVDFVIRYRRKDGVEHELARIEETDTAQTWQCGRSSEMDIKFGRDDKSISRHQFDLTRQRKRLILTNRGSRSIDVNGKTIRSNRRIQIKDGMIVTLPKSVLRFSTVAPATHTYDLVLREGITSRRVKIEGERLSIGKHESNDVVVAGEGVSRLHLELAPDAVNKGVFQLSDVGSRNGFAMVKPVSRKVAPGESCTLKCNESFRFGSVTGSIEKHRSAFFRRRPLFVAAAIFAILVMLKILNPPPVVPAPCVEIIAAAMRHEDLSKRVQAVRNLSSAHDRDIMECADCRAKLSDLGSIAAEMHQWTLLLQQLDNTREALRNAFARGLWDRSPDGLRDRRERIASLQAIYKGLKNFDLSRFGKFATPNGEAFQDREKRLDAIVEKSKSSGMHAPVEWPPLLDIEAVRAQLSKIEEETLALLGAAEQAEQALERIFEAGIPEDDPLFIEALSLILIPAAFEQAETQWHAYLTALSTADNSWQALTVMYGRIYNEMPGTKPPAPWSIASDVPPIFRQHVNTLYARPVYEYLVQSSLVTEFAQATPASRYRLVQDLLDRWPRHERVPDQANAIRAAARAYLEEQKDAWQIATREIQAVADSIRMMRRDWSYLDKDALLVQIAAAIRDLNRSLPEIRQQMFSIPIRGYENDRIRKRTQEALETEWEALRTEVEGRLYDSVREQIGQSADQVGLRKLGMITEQFVHLQQPLINNGLLRANRIAGFDRIDRRVRQDIQDQ
jgi:hypothetical protein